MNENINKLLKYLIMGLISCLTLYFIPEITIVPDEILMISFVISISYAILDRIMPSIQLVEQKND
jgi:hypothetical protein